MIKFLAGDNNFAIVAPPFLLKALILRNKVLSHNFKVPEAGFLDIDLYNFALTLDLTHAWLWLRSQQGFQILSCPAPTAQVSAKSESGLQL